MDAPTTPLAKLLILSVLVNLRGLILRSRVQCDGRCGFAFLRPLYSRGKLGLDVKSFYWMLGYGLVRQIKRDVKMCCIAASLFLSWFRVYN